MSVIDDYLMKLDSATRQELERIRKIVTTTVPEVEEVIDYGMPAFKYKGKYLIGFHVFKNHMSLFPTAEPINAMKSKLSGFKLSKGTIQFDLNNKVPETIIRSLVLYRLDAIDKQTEI